MSLEESIIKTADSLRKTNSFLNTLSKQPDISSPDKLNIVESMEVYKKKLVYTLAKKLNRSNDR